TICRHLASPWRCARILESLAGRPWFRVFVYHEAARTVPRSRRSDQRPRHERVLCDRGRTRRRPRERGGIALRRPSTTKRRESLPWRHDRSTDREQVWPGHHIVFHSTRRR